MRAMRTRQVKSTGGRLRKPGGDKRAPLPASLPKTRKRASGRADASTVTAHIRALDVDVAAEDRAYLRRKLGRRLGKFASSIERVSVRIADVNGPRGGIDQVCRIKVVLSGLPSVIVEQRDATLLAAIDAALGAAERAVRRSLQRRRMKPIKQSRGGAAAT
jgi:ribosome-associated translation inhibitor RaiA